MNTQQKKRKIFDIMEQYNFKITSLLDDMKKDIVYMLENIENDDNLFSEDLELILNEINRGDKRI